MAKHRATPPARPAWWRPRRNRSVPAMHTNTAPMLQITAGPGKG